MSAVLKAKRRAKAMEKIEPPLLDKYTHRMISQAEALKTSSESGVDYITNWEMYHSVKFDKDGKATYDGGFYNPHRKNEKYQRTGWPEMYTPILPNWYSKLETHGHLWVEGSSKGKKEFAAKKLEDAQRKMSLLLDTEQLDAIPMLVAERQAMVDKIREWEISIVRFAISDEAKPLYDDGEIPLDYECLHMVVAAEQEKGEELTDEEITEIMQPFWDDKDSGFQSLLRYENKVLLCLKVGAYCLKNVKPDKFGKMPEIDNSEFMEQCSEATLADKRVTSNEVQLNDLPVFGWDGKEADARKLKFMSNSLNNMVSVAFKLKPFDFSLKGKRAFCLQIFQLTFVQEQYNHYEAKNGPSNGASGASVKKRKRSVLPPSAAPETIDPPVEVLHPNPDGDTNGHRNEDGEPNPKRSRANSEEPSEDEQVSD